MDAHLLRRSCWRVAAAVLVGASTVGGLYSVTAVRSRAVAAAAGSPTAEPPAPESDEPRPAVAPATTVDQAAGAASRTVPTVPPQPAAPSGDWPGELPSAPPPVPTTVVTHAPTLDELADSVYLIDRLADHGGEQAYPAGVPLTFTRDERGVRMTTGSCDLLAGYVDIEGDRLVVTTVDAAGARHPALSRTTTPCQGDVLMADDVLMALLSARPTVAIADDQLVVAGEDASLRARRQAG